MRRDYLTIVLSIFMLVLLIHQIDQEKRIECFEQTGHGCPSWMERTRL